MSDIKVVTLHEHTLHDVPAVLRRIADKVEAGTYGAVGCCAIAMLADQLNVFSCGPDSDGPSAACVLQAGANDLINSIVGHGK